MRDIESLVAVDNPAWPHLQQALAESDTAVLPVDPEQGRRSLWELQVTAASAMGAVALHTGGIVVDHGWVRLYGGGSEHLPSIAEANGLGGSVSAPPGELVVGHDVLGGLFAIDGGALGVAPGEVCYFGSDTLEWDGLGGGYSAFLLAALAGLAGRGGVLGAEPGHLSLPSAVHRPGRWREQGDEVGRQYPGAAGHCVIRGSVQRIGPTPFEVPCDGILRLDPDPGDLPRTRGSAAVAAST